MDMHQDMPLFKLLGKVILSNWNTVCRLIMSIFFIKHIKGNFIWISIEIGYVVEN